MPKNDRALAQRVETVAVKYSLTEAQERLLAVLIQPESRLKTVKDICEMADISRDSYYRYFRGETNFLAAYREACQVTLTQAVLPTMQSLANQAASGDVQACKAILELSGLYAPGIRLNIAQQTSTNDKPTLADLWRRKREKEGAEERDLRGVASRD